MADSSGYAAGDDRLAVRGRALLLGVVLFLASELMFFAAWFGAYYDLRGHTDRWPPAGVTLDFLEPTIGTLVLGVSSLLVLLATRELHARNYALTRLYLGAAIACGAAFLAITVHGWLAKTFTIASNAYGSVYFSMTGFHALHVFAGVLAMTYLFAGAREPAFLGANAAGAEGIGYYWHFVFVVWLAIYATIYLVR